MGKRTSASARTETNRAARRAIRRGSIWSAALVSFLAPCAHAGLANPGFEIGLAGNVPPAPWVAKYFTNPSIVYPAQTLSDLQLQSPDSINLSSAATVAISGGPTQPDAKLGSTASLRWPLLGNQSALLNFNGSHRSVTELSQTITVGAGDVDQTDNRIHVRFSVAPVLQNPGHLPPQQPYAFVEVVNQTRGTQLFHAFYSPDQVNLPWQSVNPNTPNAYVYLPWQMIDASADSSALQIGDMVEVRVIASGCGVGSVQSPGAHEGHIYVDSSPMTPSAGRPFVTATAAPTATAPGAITYTYSYGNYSGSMEPGAQITIASPQDATGAALAFSALGPAPGMACTTPMTGSPGTVTCYIVAPLLPGASVQNALQITYALPANAAGPITHTNYSITSNNWQRLLGPTVLTRVQYPQTLSFPAQLPPTQPYVGGATFAINPVATSASPNSGNPIVYSSNTPTVCTVDNATARVAIVSTGLCTIAANQAAGGNYNAAAEVSQSVTIGNAPAFTSAANTTFTAGVAGSFTVAASAAPTPSLSAAPPAWTSFVDNHDGTATLSATPPAGSVGNASFAIQAGNPIGTATQNFSLTVAQAASTVSVMAPASFTLGAPANLSVNVAPATANSLVPGGSFNIALGTASCSATLINGSGSCSLTPTTAGAQTLAATYLGDADFSASSASIGVTVNKVTTTLTVVAPGNLAYRQAATVGATVTPHPAPGSGALPAPAGTVTISDGLGGPGDSCTFSLPTGSCAITPSGTGTTALNAVFVPSDQVYAGSNGSANVTIAKAAQTITFPTQSPSTHAFVNGGTFAINPPATASSGLDVVYSSKTPGVCAVGGTLVTIAGSGTCTIAADQSGDANHDAATQATQSVTVGNAPTITSAAAASFTVGASTSFTVRAGGVPAPGLSTTPPGWASFVDNGDGTATLSGTAPAGSAGSNANFTIRANNAAGSATQNFALSIDKAASKVSVTAPASITIGSSTAITVAVGAVSANTLTPSGDVSVSDGGTGPGDTCTITLPATTCTLTPNRSGSLTLTAAYAGDANFLAGTGSAALGIGASASAVTLTSSSSTPTAGSPVVLTAAVTGLSPSGTVAFRDGQIVLCAAVSLAASGTSTIATCRVDTLTPGVHSITAAYSGDSNNAASTSQAIGVTVSPNPTTMSLVAAPDPVAAGQALTLTATVSAGNVPTSRGVPAQSGAAGTAPAPTGTVTFYDGADAIGTRPLDAGGSAILSISSLAAGVHALAATYAGDGSFARASANATVTVNAVTTPSSSPTVAAPTLSPSMLSLLGGLLAAIAVGRFPATKRARTESHD